MSTDLAFWRSTPPRDPNPAATYRALMDGITPAHLAVLPITEIVAAVLAAFPDAVREPNGPAEWVLWNLPDRDDMFELNWSSRHVVATLRGHWPNEVPNGIIDALAEFGLPLYDPQTDERFDSYPG